MKKTTSLILAGLILAARPIAFSSCAATGDRIGNRLNDGSFWWYGSAIYLAGPGQSAGAKTRIRFCEVSWADLGVAIDSWPCGQPLTVRDCTFAYNFVGLVAKPTNGATGVTARNNLFHDLSFAAVWTDHSTQTAKVENCTVYRSPIAVGAHALTTLRNNLFAECDTVVSSSVATVRDHNYGDDAGETDAKFDFGTPPTRDINQRFFLKFDSPCHDAGTTWATVVRLADYSTWRTGSADRGSVDIGYHYGPVCMGGYDSDSDGMDDQWEVFHFGSLAARDGTEDEDGDGMTTAEEYASRCNPKAPDIAIRLYRDDAYSKPVSDWDEWPGHWRQSPRYVFNTYSSNPNSPYNAIYVEVRGVLAESTVAVEVVSESDPGNPVSITLTETSAESGIFRSTDDPLYLWTETSNITGGGHKLKVVDEDAVNFSAPTVSSAAVREVVLDRGEWAACGLQPVYELDEDALQWGAGSVCHLFCGGSGWFPDDVGEPFNLNPMADFIRAAGTNLAHSRQADFLQTTSHGSSNGSLMDGTGNGGVPIFTPDIDPGYLIHAQEWNHDLDWVLFHGCGVLTWTEGANRWEWAMDGNPRRLHGILGGYSWLSTGTGMGTFWTLLDPTQEHKTYVEAYKEAKNPFPQEFWSCYYRTDNADDRLDEVTPDNDEANPLYTYEDRTGTRRTGHGLRQLGSNVSIFDDGHRAGGNALAIGDKAGELLPAAIHAKKIFPTLRDHFPVGGRPHVYASGLVVHTGSWNVAGRISPYTQHQAEDIAIAFVQREMPALAGRIGWLGTDEIRWGTHRGDEPLELHSGGYCIVGEITYEGIPMVNDTITITILGEGVESVSITCHEVESAGLQRVKAIACDDAVRQSQASLKGALGPATGYELVQARLVYVSCLDPDSVQAAQDRVAFRPAWEAFVRGSPEGSGRWEATVYLDAATGVLIGPKRR